MLQQFTRSELQSFNRTQLWSLCRERGLKCYPKTADCVEAIWNKQQSVEKIAEAEVARCNLSTTKISDLKYLITFDSKTYVVRDSYDAFDFESDVVNPIVVELLAASIKEENQEIYRTSTFDRALLFLETGVTDLAKNVDEQAIAQAELVAHITDQSETIAPEIHTVEITFYDHEVYALGKQIASITHDTDDFQTQRWVVMVGETEVHRADAWAKCFEYVRWHYKQGTLPVKCEVQCEPEPTKVIEFENYKLVYDGGESPRDYKVYKDSSPRGLIWQWSTHWSNGIDNVQHDEPVGAAVALSEWFDKPKPSDSEELLDKPFDELTVDEWKQLKLQSADLQQKLELAYTNSNFGCYNRAGAEALGNEFLLKERRRVASGELVMVACDIAGMGRRNSEIGEVAVNSAIATSLKEIRSWRGIFFISQLNSGDEFVFIVDKADAIDIIPRMNALFQDAGFQGIYGAVEPINDDYIKSANDGMELVYKLKQFAKTL